MNSKGKGEGSAEKPWQPTVVSDQYGTYLMTGPRSSTLLSPGSSSEAGIPAVAAKGKGKPAQKGGSNGGGAASSSDAGMPAVAAKGEGKPSQKGGSNGEGAFPAKGQHKGKSVGKAKSPIPATHGREKGLKGIATMKGGNPAAVLGQCEKGAGKTASEKSAVKGGSEPSKGFGKLSDKPGAAKGASSVAQKGQGDGQGKGHPGKAGANMAAKGDGHPVVPSNKIASDKGKSNLGKATEKGKGSLGNLTPAAAMDKGQGHHGKAAAEAFQKGKGHHGKTAAEAAAQKGKGRCGKAAAELAANKGKGHHGKSAPVNPVEKGHAAAVVAAEKGKGHHGKPQSHEAAGEEAAAKGNGHDAKAAGKAAAVAAADKGMGQQKGGHNGRFKGKAKGKVTDQVIMNGDVKSEPETPVREKSWQDNSPSGDGSPLMTPKGKGTTNGILRDSDSTSYGDGSTTPVCRRVSFSSDSGPV